MVFYTVFMLKMMNFSQDEEDASYASVGFRCNVMGLAPNKEYIVRAKAKNSAGKSEWSPKSEQIPTKKSPPKPTKPTRATPTMNMDAAADGDGDGSRSITVVWGVGVPEVSACECQFDVQYAGRTDRWKDAPSDALRWSYAAAGADETGAARVTSSGNTYLGVSTEWTCCIGGCGLEAGKKYTVQVRAKNDAGVSGWSSNSDYMAVDGSDDDGDGDGSGSPGSGVGSPAGVEEGEPPVPLGGAKTSRSSSRSSSNSGGGGGRSIRGSGSGSGRAAALRLQPADETTTTTDDMVGIHDDQPYQSGGIHQVKDVTWTEGAGRYDATCYLLLATCYLLLATCYLPLATCYLLLAAFEQAEDHLCQLTGS